MLFRSYPGGPIIDKMAANGNPTYKLPHVKLAKDSYDFSFSGLKSAVINLCNKLEMKHEDINALLSMSDDLEYQQSVLIEYGIIDKKTKRVVNEDNSK